MVRLQPGISVKPALGMLFLPLAVLKQLWMESVHPCSLRASKSPSSAPAWQLLWAGVGISRDLPMEGMSSTSRPLTQCKSQNPGEGECEHALPLILLLLLFLFLLLSPFPFHFHFPFPFSFPFSPLQKKVSPLRGKHCSFCRKV